MKSRAGIHQALFLHFSLLAEFLIGKLPVHILDSRGLAIVNLTYDFLEI